MKVKCNTCEYEFSSNAKAENIEAGKIKCKECADTNLTILPDAPEVEPKKPEEKPAEPVAKGTQQLMDEGDRARRKGVDALNEKVAANQKKAAGELVDTPLTAEEQAFVAETAAKMNCGRPVESPSAAEILRYSRLVGRVDVVAEE